MSKIEGLASTKEILEQMLKNTKSDYQVNAQLLIKYEILGEEEKAKHWSKELEDSKKLIAGINERLAAFNIEIKEKVGK